MKTLEMNIYVLVSAENRGFWGDICLGLKVAADVKFSTCPDFKCKNSFW